MDTTQYREEAKARYGGTKAYAECEEKHQMYDKQKEEQIALEADKILKDFAEARLLSSDSKSTQALVADWQAHITKYHYHCTKEILSGLGEMYVDDERFRAYIDRFGEGTAVYMRDAIRIFCA